MRKFSLLLIIAVFAVFSNTVASFDSSPPATQGSLDAFTNDGKALGNSPLKHTKVKADISGFIARITVEQEFVNNFSQPIEAVYRFPLSKNSAVDDMTMKIGSRTIRGKIKKREEARKIYEQAKTDGKTASLLDQERPNVFTQSVANILPNEKIVIEISYVENLKYEDGSYEFIFPMVVGERYTPASTKAKDAKRVSPPTAKTRAGHDISIEVNLDAGVPIENVSSKLHEITSQNLSSNSTKITLRKEKTIPNKDFILKYDVTGKRIEDAILTHRDERGGFFTMMLSPPEDFRVEDVSPKEIVFVLDTSGSMSGFPIETAKATMKMSLEGLYPNDKFNLITFAGDTHVLFDEPVYATQENLEKTQYFLESRRGSGGTEMMKAVTTALKPSDSSEHLRIVNFMTDGYVNNELEIIREIQKHSTARVFSFGIGNSVNRYLLSKMAEEGRGEVSFVTLEDDGTKAARKFHERIRNPLLTDISIDWNGLPVADLYPNRIPDLFDAKPVVINGRFTKKAKGTIKLKGKVGGQNYEREIQVDFPEKEPNHDVLATLWARKRIGELTHKNFDYETEKANLTPKAIKQITQIGLEFQLLTDYTSFLAVEEVIRTQGGQTVKVEVPVERANGTFGEGDDGKSSSRDPFSKPGLSKTPSIGKLFQRKRVNNQNIAPTVGTGSGSGSGNGNAPPPPPPPPSVSAKRISGGVINGKAVRLPAPKIPAAAKAANIKGTVNVKVVIDESGNVISTIPVSGHPLLRASAATAARNSKFVPTMISGKPVQVSGVVVYNFGGGSPIPLGTPQENTIATVAITPEKAFENMLKQKLHIWVYDLVERQQNGKSKAAQNEDKFVQNDIAKLKILLSNKSAKTLDNLRDLGFEITDENGKDFVIGRIEITKIADFVEIEQIEYVLPSLK